MPRRESEASFLAPMWAQRKVGFLLEQIRLSGESEELKSEIIELGERYGIVTPYTAYLVIEEHMHRAEMEGLDFAAPAAEAAQRMAREAIAARTRPDASLYAGRAGSQRQTGEADIQLSVAERNLQTATAWQQASYLKVQRIEEKTFQLDEESGIWKDQTIRPEQRIIEVEVGSDEFVRLLRQHDSLARYAAIGEQVEVQLGSQAYRLILK
jgi:Ca-activated chloride channel family protein